MTLSTVSEQGRPRSRQVLLKAFDERGAVFLHQPREPEGRGPPGSSRGLPELLLAGARSAGAHRGQGEPRRRDDEADAYFRDAGSRRQPARRLGIEAEPPAPEQGRAPQGGRPRRSSLPRRQGPAPRLLVRLPRRAGLLRVLEGRTLPPARPRRLGRSSTASGGTSGSPRSRRRRAPGGVAGDGGRVGRGDLPVARPAIGSPEHGRRRSHGASRPRCRSANEVTQPTSAPLDANRCSRVVVLDELEPHQVGIARRREQQHAVLGVDHLVPASVNQVYGNSSRQGRPPDRSDERPAPAAASGRSRGPGPAARHHDGSPEGRAHHDVRRRNDAIVSACRSTQLAKSPVDIAGA